MAFVESNPVEFYMKETLLLWSIHWHDYWVALLTCYPAANSNFMVEVHVSRVKKIHENEIKLWYKYKCEGVIEVSGQENIMEEKGHELGG